MVTGENTTLFYMEVDNKEKSGVSSLTFIKKNTFIECLLCIR